MQNAPYYLQPVTVRGKNTLKQSVENYKNYCRSKGVPVFDNTHKAVIDKKNLLILERAKQGARRSELIAEFGTSMAVAKMIATSMEFRPPRKHRTDLLYLWGPAGVGKTTEIHRTLEAIQDTYGIEYYQKMGGLKRFWDGYDDQPIVWIDDPLPPNDNNNDDKQHLRTVISTGKILVEIKFGSMIFDAKLLIISANQDASNMAYQFGVENHAPMYRRFTDTCGEYCIQDRKM